MVVAPLAGAMLDCTISFIRQQSPLWSPAFARWSPIVQQDHTTATGHTVSQTASIKARPASTQPPSSLQMVMGLFLGRCLLGPIMNFNTLIGVCRGGPGADNELYQPTPVTADTGALLPVGTGGGVERMRGPGACPRWDTAASSGQQDKHRAPAHPLIHPLSLQGGDRCMPDRACHCS